MLLGQRLLLEELPLHALEQPNILEELEVLETQTELVVEVRLALMELDFVDTITLLKAPMEELVITALVVLVELGKQLLEDLEHPMFSVVEEVGGLLTTPLVERLVLLAVEGAVVKQVVVLALVDK